MINIKDSLILDDDNEYVVVSKTNYVGTTYYYILDKENSENFKVCFQENDELIEVDNEKLIRELIPLFFKNAQKEIMDFL